VWEASRKRILLDYFPVVVYLIWGPRGGSRSEQSTLGSTREHAGTIPLKASTPV
jgi:hypothetical protein